MFSEPVGAGGWSNKSAWVLLTTALRPSCGSATIGSAVAGGFGSGRATATLRASKSGTEAAHQRLNVERAVLVVPGFANRGRRVVQLSSDGPGVAVPGPAVRAEGQAIAQVLGRGTWHETFGFTPA